MAAKLKCPACGAKNPVTNHRCRICTAIINPGAATLAEEEPVAPVGLDHRLDHFDASEIDRQVRPARERFGSSSGALAARLAAAQGDEVPPHAPGPDTAWPDGVSDTTWPDAATTPTDPQPDPPMAPPTSTAPPAAAPLEYEAEPFDPDALFRDMA